MDEARASGQPTGDESAQERPAGLDAGGHEPAPPSGDPVSTEARDSIQDAFDKLEATHADDELWEAAGRRADDAPAPGMSTDDAAPDAASGAPEGS